MSAASGYAISASTYRFSDGRGVLGPKQSRRTTEKDVRAFLMLRHEHGLSVGKLAEQLKLSKATISTVSLDAQRARRAVAPCPMVRAVDYMIRRDGFARFLDDGRICLTNNAPDCTSRQLCLGRRFRLFAGSDRGSMRATSIYTLIGTAAPTKSTRRLARRSPRQNRRHTPDTCARTAALALE